MALQRLQKILAQAGIASRRSAERLILDGRVRVNGRVISELGARANPQRDRVEVDGKRLVAEKPVYFLMHKPRGVVTTLDDPEGRKSVKDLLRTVPERVFPVGRLDFQTSGALLLTNDGAMAQALLHPARRVPKVYHAKIQGSLDEQRLELLRSGVTLDDGERTAPAEVDIVRKDDKHTFIEVTISEGKNRQIHRMLDAVGRVVLRLTRLAFADLALEGLRPGQMRPLTQAELGDLKQKYLNPSKKVRRGAGAPQLETESFSDEEEPRTARPSRESGRRSSRGGADPRGSKRRGVDLRGVDPRRADPRRRDGRDARGVDPRGVDPRRADARRTDARVADPRSGHRRGEDPRGVDPRRADPRRRDARGVDPRGVDPRRKDARRTDARRGDRRGEDPRGEDPRGVDARRTDARRTDARRGDRRGEDPRGEDPRGVDPRRADPRARRRADADEDLGARRTRLDSRRADPRAERTRVLDSESKSGQRGRKHR